MLVVGRPASQPVEYRSLVASRQRASILGRHRAVAKIAVNRVCPRGDIGPIGQWPGPGPRSVTRSVAIAIEQRCDVFGVARRGLRAARHVERLRSGRCRTTAACARRHGEYARSDDAGQPAHATSFYSIVVRLRCPSGAATALLAAASAVGTGSRNLAIAAARPAEALSRAALGARQAWPSNQVACRWRPSARTGGTVAMATAAIGAQAAAAAVGQAWRRAHARARAGCRAGAAAAVRAERTDRSNG